MTDRRSKAALSEKWAAEVKALRKVQVHFTFTALATRRLKYQAIDQELTPSNLVRKIIGLSYDVSARHRIGLSLTEEDFAKLSQRYRVDIDDRLKIKQHVTAEINNLFQSPEAPDTQSADDS